MNFNECTTIYVLETNLSTDFSPKKSFRVFLIYREITKNQKYLYVACTQVFRKYLALKLSIGLVWTLPPPKKDVGEYQFRVFLTQYKY